MENVFDVSFPFGYFAQKLEALEREEEMRERAGFYDSDTDDDPEMDEIRQTARKSVLGFSPWVMYLITVGITKAFSLSKLSLFCKVQSDVASLWSCGVFTLPDTDS